MSDNLCLCGHLKVSHMRDRGRCCGTDTFIFGRMALKPPPNVKLLDPENKEHVKTWNKILEDVKASRRDLVRQRKFRYLDCTCPMFHLIDLGQVKILTP